MNIHIVTHERFEAPAAIELRASNKSFPITYTRLYEGDIFPNDTTGFDFLIVMGGPQSPATTLEECPHFDAAKEIAFIKQVADADKLLLGVCLGAQMIGEALGARFEHSPHREIGVFPVTLTDAAKDYPIFSTFPPQFPVGHRHGDMPGLTEDAVILATSEGCPRQIVRYTPKIYGFQCHFEFTPKSIEGMITHCGDELETYKDLPYIWSAEQRGRYEYSGINNLLFTFLDYMERMFVLYNQGK